MHFDNLERCLQMPSIADAIEIENGQRIFFSFDIIRSLGNAAVHLLRPPEIDGHEHKPLGKWGVDTVIKHEAVTAAIGDIFGSNAALSFLQLHSASGLSSIEPHPIFPPPSGRCIGEGCVCVWMCLCTT
jgi:hypothetical protein